MRKALISQRDGKLPGDGLLYKDKEMCKPPELTEQHSQDEAESSFNYQQIEVSLPFIYFPKPSISYTCTRQDISKA